jgi:hypothetical protein
MEVGDEKEREELSILFLLLEEHLKSDGSRR